MPRCCFFGTYMCSRFQSLFIHDERVASTKTKIRADGLHDETGTKRRFLVAVKIPVSVTVQNTMTTSGRTTL